MNSHPKKVVFDCNIFTQALMNPLGPAGGCLDAVINGRVMLYISDFVLQEIRNIPSKPAPRKVGVTSLKVESLIQLLTDYTERIADPPEVYLHPIDPDDSAYINLALAADAKLVVSRDRHLLNLHNPAKPWSADFRSRFPFLQIVSAENLLAELRQDEDKPI